MLIKCPECGHQVSDQARTCPSCGIDIAGKITRCPDCGEVIFKEQESCPNCHCSINAAATTLISAPPRDVETEKLRVDDGTSRMKPEQSKAAPRKPKRTYTALIVAFVLVLIIVFLGFYFYKNTQEQNELRAYQNAVRSAEPAVLQNFLDMYTDAPKQHRDSVEMHLAALKKIESDWTEAVLTGSKAEIEKYMNRYPQSVHITEAKIKIDSLDWVAAEADGTQQAYQRYMDAHDDGAHYDDARDRYERMEAQKVNSDDRQMVTRLFGTFFRALAQRDEDLLTPTLAPVLSSFLHKEQATKADVMQYMDRIHEMDITAMEFVPNNDWHIEKKPVGNNAYTYTYTVDFTVDQKMERTNPERERFCTYKVNAAISDDGKITALNMKRSVQ
jgi:hypothetical protein